MPNPIPITTVISGILSIALVPLTVPVSYLRGKAGIQFLDGGNQTLLPRIRAHGDFVETMPITPLAMACAELAGHSTDALWRGKLAGNWGQIPILSNANPKFGAMRSLSVRFRLYQHHRRKVPRNPSHIPRQHQQPGHGRMGADEEVGQHAGRGAAPAAVVTKALPARKSAALGMSITGICSPASASSSASTVLKVSESSA